jgi:Ca-activated chloride channel family protein
MHYSSRQIAQTDPFRNGGIDLRFWFLFLPRLTVAALLILLLSASPARSGPLPEDGVTGGGRMYFQQAGSGPYAPALSQHGKVHFAVSGMLANVTLEQTFRNTGTTWAEGIYAFPLPGAAAVRRLEMVIGERRIVGSVHERDQASAAYQRAREAGSKATLLEQQRPNLFSTRVANIGPGEEVTVRLEYVETLQYRAGAFSLRFPMTITPRYMPGVPLVDPTGEGSVPLVANPLLGWATATTEVPDAAAISPLQHPRSGSDTTPLNPIGITATLDPGMPLASVDAAYHEITLARSKDVYEVSLASAVSEMDRDFLLRWVPVVGAEPQAAVFTEKVGGDHYALLMIVPPRVAGSGHADPGDALFREVVFVVDTSGSMGGTSIEQARASLDLALRQLRPGDYFNVIAFNSTSRALHREPVPANRHHVASAREFVRQLQATGGTEMLPALRRAFAIPEGEREDGGERLRQIVFITDGAVGNELTLYREIEATLGDARLFTVGIGSAPNSWFMRKAAGFGRGTYTFIGAVGEVADKMSALLGAIATPLVTDISVQWPGAGTVEAWPQRLPDLYPGEPLVLAARLPPPEGASGEVVISGRTAGHSWSRRLQVDAAAAGAGHAGVATLWARRKISALLDQRVLGVAEDQVRAQVLPVALAHQLLSPFTSFVAVEEQQSRPGGATLAAQAVANTRPQGQTPQVFAYPVTATTGPAKAYLGLLLLFLALLTHVLRRPEMDRERVQQD